MCYSWANTWEWMKSSLHVHLIILQYSFILLKYNYYVTLKQNIIKVRFTFYIFCIDLVLVHYFFFYFVLIFFGYKIIIYLYNYKFIN
jgi:hypothetical protein